MKSIINPILSKSIVTLNNKIINFIRDVDIRLNEIYSLEPNDLMFHKLNYNLCHITFDDNKRQNRYLLSVKRVDIDNLSISDSKIIPHDLMKFSFNDKLLFLCFERYNMINGSWPSYKQEIETMVKELSPKNEPIHNRPLLGTAVGNSNGGLVRVNLGGSVTESGIFNDNGLTNDRMFTGSFVVRADTPIKKGQLVKVGTTTGTVEPIESIQGRSPISSTVFIGTGNNMGNVFTSSDIPAFVRLNNINTSGHWIVSPFSQSYLYRFQMSYPAFHHFLQPFVYYKIDNIHMFKSMLYNNPLAYYLLVSMINNFVDDFNELKREEVKYNEVCLGVMDG